MDSDHLDIYHTHEAIYDAFRDYASNITTNGALILKKGLETFFENSPDYKIYTYAVDEPADFCCKNLQLINGLYQFDFYYPAGKIDNLTLGIPGLYNVENAVAAIAAAILAGVKPEEISSSLKSFRGVKRRFDVRINEPSLVYIDDYAHHPEELRACISSAREMFPGKRITGIFQPHLYSRTKDFAAEFAESLSLLDEVLLLAIYPARELPIEGVNSAMLLSLIQNNSKFIIQKEDLPNFFINHKPEILLTMGAGDIDTLVSPIEDYFKTIINNHS
jgi:UDP-N-acetylmuramate--alanine ligase